MARILMQESYKMRVDTEADAMALIEEERENQEGNPEFKTAHKERKETKNREYEEWYEVTVTRKFKL